jgi:hypothetical protein
MKETVCTLTGILGSGLCLLFGGWDAAMMALTVGSEAHTYSGVSPTTAWHTVSLSLRASSWPIMPTVMLLR